MKKNFVIFFFVFFILEGCGYRPSTYYTTPLLGNKIYTQVDIDITNPTDFVYLKDALNEAVLSVFNAKRVPKKEADSSIKLSIKSINFEVLDYDKNGYPILYRANTSITATIVSKNNKTYTYTGGGSYDFSVLADSVLSDNLKHNAIKEAFLRALQIIEFKIAQKGMDNDN